MEYALEIVRKYIGLDASPTYGEVNLDEHVRYRLVDDLKNAAFLSELKVAPRLPASFFDEAQSCVFVLMEQDSYRKFLASAKFKHFQGPPIFLFVSVPHY